MLRWTVASSAMKKSLAEAPLVAGSRRSWFSRANLGGALGYPLFVDSVLEVLVWELFGSACCAQ